jgi:hypothetical protein
MNKRFVVERHGEVSYCIIRQMPHDTQYSIGSTIPGYGKVVAYGDATIALAQNEDRSQDESVFELSREAPRLSF